MTSILARRRAPPVDTGGRLTAGEAWTLYRLGSCVRWQRGHVDHGAVTHSRRLVDLVDADHLALRYDAARCAEVDRVLGLSDAAEPRVHAAAPRVRNAAAQQQRDELISLIGPLARR